MEETPKVIVTVTEMARMCGLGRSRFYQLIGTTFPYPLYDVSTRRPFYNQEMQKVCLEVRRRNCGIDGIRILFYSKPINRKRPAKKANHFPQVQEHAELVEGLNALGMNANATQVNGAVRTLFPNGANGVDYSSLLRAVFIHLKTKDKKN